LSHRVALVDDDPDYRYLVRLALEGAGHEVVGEAGDARGAVALAAEEQPDLVLLDVDLPGADGLSAIPQIRAACPGCLIVLVSGFPSDVVRRSITMDGAVGHISKRIRPSKLGDEVTALAGMLQLVGRVVEASTTELPAELLSTRHARKFVDEALQRWEFEELGATVTLLVSELVANAVTHAHSPAEVTVQLLPASVRIEVTDRDPNVPKRRLADEDATSGRGLTLVEQLASSWGIDQLPDGKRIWFEVPRPDGGVEP
jgi:DNA-binding NarL/FixJ family response regulator